ncbi:MAG: NrsF family protein [Alphaproteobacteria bacterium]|nr:NrsF family protein [Alphaproteobacteria bacterium]MCD8570561.1 NrsF family protein [Alphaproteobacteria bacterium]
MNSKLDTEQLIERLSGECMPLKPLLSPFVRALIWTGAAVLYTAFCIWFLGVRSDIQDVLYSPYFIIDNLIVLLTGLGAVLASAWLCVPDMRGARWMSIPPLLGTIAFIVWVAFRSMEETIHMPDLLRWRHCFSTGLMLGFIPALVMALMIRRACTTAPLLMALMNSLAVAAMAFIGLHIICANDEITHAVIEHLLPFLLAGGITGLLARRLYRW